MIEVRQPEATEIPELYNILESYPSIYHDGIGEAKFVEWFHENAKLPLVGVLDGRILAFSYLDHVVDGYYASVVFARRKGKIPFYELIQAIKNVGIPYYFDNLDIVKLVATIPEGHSASMLFVPHVGFARDGILRKHAKLNGQWKDYHLYTLLKEEL